MKFDPDVLEHMAGLKLTQAAMTTVFGPYRDNKYDPYVVGNMSRRRYKEVDGVLTIDPTVHRDARGQFAELFNPSLLDLFPNGVQQVSASKSNRKVLRGMHFQHGMAKMIRVTNGHAQVVVADIRRDSLTYKGVKSFDMVWNQGTTLFVPAGCAVGFLALDDCTNVNYFHSTPFNPETSHAIAWDDQTLNINWELGGSLPTMTAKDWRALPLAAYEANNP
jgi:dTDP-4-dehydrorhamnose 3,5-epimerase